MQISWKNEWLKFVKVYILLMLLNINGFVAGLKCFCNPSDCDFLRQNDCPGKMIVLDACKCCPTCAKIEGEPCGGTGNFHGFCKPPLKCISRPPVIGTGVCLELPLTSSLRFDAKTKTKKCHDTIVIRPGCEIVEKKCECWLNPTVLCRENLENISRWDFTNIEECELNLAKVIESESEFDEDYTVKPKSYEFIKILDKRKSKLSHKKKTSHKSSYRQL